MPTLPDCLEAIRARHYAVFGVNMVLLSSCAVQWDAGGAATLRCNGNACSLTVDANATAFRITEIVEAEKEASDGAFTRATRAHKGKCFSCWDLFHTK